MASVKYSLQLRETRRGLGWLLSVDDPLAGTAIANDLYAAKIPYEAFPGWRGQRWFVPAPDSVKQELRRVAIERAVARYGHR